jgi:hypothetical protein
MAPSKPTSIDIDALKSALNTLKSLQSRMGNGTGGAYSTLQGAQDINADLGPLLNGNGPQVAGYYQQHAMRIQQAIMKSGVGVGAAVEMLQASIQKIEANEKAHRDGANGTATGGGGGGVTSARGAG